jgi:RHS repeat-associated protein
VEKANGTTASSGTIYWYMSPGIVAESDLAGTLKSEYVFFGGQRMARRDLVTPTGVFYYFSDHLKTASVIADSAGVIKAESDYYPWGGELKFVNADSNHYKFTGKERDTETGLDYFGARYYSNGLGRFITPDWAARPITVAYADFSDPQTLNLYGYVRGLPTVLVDADGHGWWGDFGGGVYDSTVGPIVQTVAHPIDTAFALGHAAAHPINTTVAIGHATVETATALAHGDARAVGQVVGTVVSAVATAGAGKVATSLIKGAKVAEVAETAAKTANLATRAEEVHAVLDPIAQEMRTTAALGTKEGTTVIGGGARDLTQAQRAALKPGEIAAKMPGEHAEVTVINGATQNGLTPRSLATTREICPTCKAAIEKSGGTVTGPRSAEWK